MADSSKTLAESESRTQHLLEQMHAMMVEFDEAGRLIYVSPTVTEVLGYLPEELVATDVLGWIHPDDIGEIREFRRKLHGSGRAQDVAYRACHKDGRWLWLHTRSVQYRAPGGGLHTVSFTQDVTELRKAGDRLRESEDRFRAMAENASDLIAEVDPDGRFLYISPNAETIIGRPPSDIVGRTLREIFLTTDELDPADRERLVEGFDERVALPGGGGRIEFSFRHPDGTLHWLESVAKTYRRSDGALRSVVISRDITQAVRAQQRVRQSEERYRIVAEATRDLVTEHDSDGRLLYASAACEFLTGYKPEEVIGTTPFHMVHPDDIERAVEVFLEGTRSRSSTHTSPYRIRRRDGTYRWMEGAGTTYVTAEGETRFLAINRDVSERIDEETRQRRFEERMQQAQKLESLGVLAGGVAHDFNNLLTPILGDASLALAELPENAPVKIRLERIQKAAQRAAALTHQMLAYSGKGPLSIEALDVSKLVREMGELLESSVSKKADLVFALCDDLPPVDADAAQLSRVAMNLIINATEALGDTHGRIELRTGLVDVARAREDSAPLPEDLPEGNCVFLEVIDSGCGMDAETRARIFDPFFTTKFAGRGLGLAAVLGIVRGHGGAVEIDSAPGAGTRFRVLFPASQTEARPAAAPSRREDWQGSGTVLVVDDDEGVRELSREALSRAGLAVLCAADGRSGIEILRDQAGAIDVVLLDRTMPDMRGDEVFEEMHRIAPRTRIVLVSGYSEERAARNFSRTALAGFIQKPFLPSSLVATVRNLLER